MRQHVRALFNWFLLVLSCMGLSCLSGPEPADFSALHLCLQISEKYLWRPARKSHPIANHWQQFSVWQVWGNFVHCRQWKPKLTALEPMQSFSQTLQLIPLWKQFVKVFQIYNSWSGSSYMALSLCERVVYQTCHPQIILIWHCQLILNCAII